MSEALKKSWDNAKKPEKTVETLTAEDLTSMGGKLWEKGNLRRVYFNRSELMQLCDLNNHKFDSRNCGRGFNTVIEHLTNAILAA